MIQANFKYWKIDSGEIWAYERNLFLSNKSTEEQAKILIDRIQTSLVKNKSYSFNITDSENKNSNGLVYLSKQREIYTEACKELKSQFEIDFFINNNSIYEYSSTNIIKKSDENFSYWFALKAKQFENNLSALPKFLAHQFKYGFEKNDEKFIRFLEDLIIQYIKEQLSQKIVLKIKNWINISLSIEQKIKPKRKSDYKTFYLKKLAENPDFLKKGKVNSNLSDILKEIKKAKIFDGGTTIIQFQNIFRANQIQHSEKIIWTGVLVELRWFVEFLEKSEIYCEMPKLDKWFVAQDCFKYKDKSGVVSDIKLYTQISDARGQEFDRKDKLEKIVQKIANLCSSNSDKI